MIFAPNRKNTFHKFVDLAKQYFECMIAQNYDDEIWQLHMEVCLLSLNCSLIFKSNSSFFLKNKESNGDYDEDIHYPLLLKLCKRDTNSGFCKMVL